MFEGFTTDQVDVGEASIFVRHGGDGPPLVLLHGQEAPDVLAAALGEFFAPR
jgi:hypothetical protein